MRKSSLFYQLMLVSFYSYLLVKFGAVCPHTPEMDLQSTKEMWNRDIKRPESPHELHTCSKLNQNFIHYKILLE